LLGSAGGGLGRVVQRDAELDLDVPTSHRNLVDHEAEKLLTVGEIEAVQGVGDRG
jgi:hypothetical protein